MEPLQPPIPPLIPCLKRPGDRYMWSKLNENAEMFSRRQLKILQVLMYGQRDLVALTLVSVTEVFCEEECLMLSSKMSNWIDELEVTSD